MAHKLYQKLISAMADEGVCNASDVDMSKQFNGQTHSKVSAIIDSIILFINGLSTTLSNLVSTGLKREIVPALPTGNDISETTIYLILKNPAGASGDIYDEYMYIGTNWEHIGSTEVDLSGYATESYVDTEVGKCLKKLTTAQTNTIYWIRGAKTIEAADASNLPFSSSITALSSYTNVTSVIDGLYGLIPTTADDIAFVNTGTLFTATNVQTALQELKTDIIGRYVEDLPSDSNYPQDIEISEVNNGIIPKDGTHYHFGSISGLIIGNETGAMKLGTTLHFSASADFTIILPYSYTDNGQDYNPAVPARMVSVDKMSCTSGSEYILTITCVCGASGNPINLFNLQELTTPTASSNDIS